VPKISAMSEWLEAVEPDTFFWSQDVPGPNRAAVRAFLHRETSKPDHLCRAFRVAPCAYWRSHMRVDAHFGQVLTPDWLRVGEFYAGPHAAKHGHYGANVCGWSTQLVASSAAFAVPGEPRCRQPVPQVKLLGRRNMRRRELTTLEATYLEAVISFDLLNTYDRYEHGSGWEQALGTTRARMRLMIDAGRLPIPRGDVLAWVARGERPPRAREMFHNRMEQLSAIFDEMYRDLDSTACAVAAPV